MNFENRTTFTDGSVGKIILCRDGDTVSLYGKLEESELAKMAKTDNAIANKEFNDYFPGEVVDRLVGQHKDIAHSGIVLGGAQALFVDGKLYLHSFSSKFGPVHLEVVQKCVGEEISVMARERNLGWGGVYSSMPSVEEYVIQKGKAAY